MADKSWKQLERRLAKVFGTTRRGANFGGWPTGGGNDDFNTDVFSCEAKLLSKPTWGSIYEAMAQAERNAQGGRCPLTLVKKKGAPDRDTLVCMRLEVFEKFFLKDDEDA